MSDMNKSPMFQPLHRGHWLYHRDGLGMQLPPKMGLRVGSNHPLQRLLWTPVMEAVQFALRATSSCGTNEDLDPDALVRNVGVGLFGYNSDTGLHPDADANPDHPGDGQLLMLEIVRECLKSGHIKPEQLQDILNTHRVVHGG